MTRAPAPVQVPAGESRRNGRVLPHDLDAERAVIGTLLLHGADAFEAIAGRLSAEDFYRPAHGHIIEAVRRLVDAGAAVDPVTVGDELRRAELLEAAGGPENLIELVRGGLAVSSIGRHVAIVAEYAARRRLIGAAGELAERGYADGCDIADTAEFGMRMLAPLHSHVGADTGALPEPLDWQRLFNEPPVDEDWLIEDFWPARRAISVTADRKAGKSLLMFYVCCCLARGVDPWTGGSRTPVTVAYFDYEMGEDDVLERAVDFGLAPDDLARLRYYLLPNVPPLDTPEGGRVVLDLLRRDEAAAVVFDTFGRVVGGEEDLADTIRAYYRCTAVHLKSAGIASARLDHTGHANKQRARGSSSKGDDIDVSWVLHRDQANGVTADHHGVSRLSWVPARLQLTLVEGPPDRYRRAAQNWPAGTAECAADLDRLDVSRAAGANEAQRALRQADKGRRRLVVLAALKYRRETAP